MNKKIIKLINDERTNAKITSAKATSNDCPAGSQDFCQLDYANCSVSSVDLCVKDYAGCTNHSYDYCGGEGGRDYHACYEGNTDTI